MTHGSLFSGIGGFDLAAEWMGWENVFHCEREPFAQRVLAHYWPESKLYEDVTTFDATKYRGTIDVLTGGFPCQPYSTAGKRLGKDDERHLWPHMLRIIREVAPRYIVGENVYGLVSWSGGLVFEEVCLDLENAGYEVQPYVLPASAVGAPHERKRVWFVAHAAGLRNNRRPANVRGTERGPIAEQFTQPFERGEIRTTSNAERDGLEHGAKRRSVKGGEGKVRYNATRYVKAKGKKSTTANAYRKCSECGNQKGKTTGPTVTVKRTKPFDEPAGWAQFPTQPPVCGGNDGLPRKLDRITFSNWRKESIKGYGNAVVPQLVYELFQAIQAYEEAKDPPTKGNS